MPALQSGTKCTVAPNMLQTSLIQNNSLSVQHWVSVLLISYVLLKIPGKAMAVQGSIQAFEQMACTEENEDEEEEQMAEDTTTVDPITTGNTVQVG